MADDIKISVELKETGRTTLKDYEKALKHADSTTKKLQDSYKSFGRSAASDIRRMSQVTNELTANLANSVKRYNAMKTGMSSLRTGMLEFSSAVKIVGTNLEGLKNKTKEYQAYVGSLNGTLTKARNEHIALGNVIAGNVVGSFIKASAASKTFVKGLSDTKGIYQLSNGMKEFGNATSILGSKLDGLKPKTSEVKQYTGKLAATINKVTAESRRLGLTIEGDVVGNFAKMAHSAQKADGSLNKTSNSIKKVGNEARKSQSKIQGMIGMLKGFVGIKFGQMISGLPAFGASVLNVTSDFQGFRNALAVAADASQTVEKRIAGANVELNAAIGIAQRYKLDIVAVTKSYSKFVNALSLTNVPLKQARGHFENFAKFARVANLSAQNTQGMFLALEQMVSKGVVSMEELRRQLGEHLPGAVNIAAQAMGMGTREFIKHVSTGQQDSLELITKLGKVLSDRVTPLVESSLEKYSANIAAVNTEWTRFKVTLGQLVSGPVNTLLKGITDILKYLNRMTHSIGETEKAIEKFAVGGEKTTEALAELREITGDFTSDGKTVVETAKAMNKEFGNMGGGIGSAVSSMGFLIIGSVALKKTFSLLLSPITSILGTFTKYGKAVGGTSPQMDLFKSSAGGVIDKLKTMMKTIVSVGIKVAKFGSIITIAIASLYALGHGIASIVERRDFDRTLTGWKKEMKELGLSTKVVNDSIISLAKTIKDLKGSDKVSAMLSLSLQQINLAEEKIKKLKEAPAKFRAFRESTNVDEKIIVQELKAAFGNSDEKIAVLQKIVDAHKAQANGLAETLKTMGGTTEKVDDTLLKMFVELGVEMADDGSKYTEVYQALLEAKKMDHPLAKELLSFAKAFDQKKINADALKKSTKEYNAEIKKYNESLKSLTENMIESKAAEEKAIATRGMSSEAITLYDAGLEHTNYLLELNRMELKAATDAQRSEIQVLREAEQAIFKTKVVRLDEVRAIADKKKALEELKKATENEIRLTSSLKTLNDAKIRSRMKDSTPLESLRLQEKINRDSIKSLERQIILYENMGDAAPIGKINELNAELIGLKDELDLVGDAFAEVFQDSFTSFFDDVMDDTKSFGDALKSLVRNITSEINSIVSKELASSFTQYMKGQTSGMGGGSNGIFGMIGDLFSGGSGSVGPSPTGWLPDIGMAMGPGHAFANGGNPPIGQASLVGEEGPELIVPRTATTIIPNHQLGGSTVVNINITSPDGNLSRQSISQLQTAVGSGIQRSMRRNG